jgi:glycosyltransferase involved in cell wall biosynthesis
MSGLRFCMVTTFYPPHNFGGDGIAIQRLSRALARRGHHVTVIHDVDAYNLLHHGPEPADTTEPEGVRVVRLRSGLRALSPMLTQQIGRPIANRNRIRQVLDEGSFDVTIFNNISLIGGPGILREGRGIVLYEAHEHWLVCASHVLWRHNREPCAGRECLRCVLHYGRPPQLWRYTGMLERELEHVDGFIAKSEFSRAKHREFGFTREMRVIPYFLPADGQEVASDRGPGTGDRGPVGHRVPGEHREPVGIAGLATGASEHARPYFLFVGRLERIKGLDDVIPVFRSYPDADLLIAGDGEYGPALRALAAGASNVHFLGRVPLARLRELYRGAIGLIVPSAGFETFGIILIESFREGVPVIARRIGPFPEIVNACNGGLLFETAEELKDAMARLQQDAELRTRMGQAARAGYETHWTEEAVVPRYVDFVNEIVARRSGGPGPRGLEGAA